jgi:hypothetical protein
MGAWLQKNAVKRWVPTCSDDFLTIKNEHGANKLKHGRFHFHLFPPEIVPVRKKIEQLVDKYLAASRSI